MSERVGEYLRKILLDLMHEIMGLHLSLETPFDEVGLRASKAQCRRDVEQSR